MKKHGIFIFIALLFLPTILVAQRSLPGDWAGSIKIMGQELRIIVHFANDSTATIDIPQQNAKGLRLTNVRHQDANVHFELPAGPGLATFDGAMKDDHIAGEFKQAGVAGTFELRPAEAMKPQAAAEAPEALRPILGGWTGAIDVGSQSLRIIVHFTSVSSELKATIDIPEQNAKEISLKNVRFDSTAVHMDLPAGLGVAVFDGHLSGDSIGGSFTQAGLAGSFGLKRGEPAEEEKASEPPPPYRVEDVVFHNDTLTLAGTLTLPPKEGRHPAVVMITGSGAQNRDEELFGFKPFKIIADYFTRHGIAVLRYDDRGVGGSSGSTSESTTSDFATDVLAALKYLQTRPDINPKEIGLCGHSEGGIVAPLAASRSKDVAFIVLIAGPGVDGERILLAQAELIMRADSASEQEINDALSVNKRIYEIVKSGKDLASFRPELENQVRREVDAMKPERRESIKDADAYIKARVDATIKQVQNPWFKYFLTYDPEPALEKVRCPVLALFGERDLQVPAEMDKTAMEKALRKGGNKDFTMKIMPKANHLFLTAVTGSPSEYATMKKEFVPGFLETMTDWILRHVTVVK
jgi:pimeloyl-ACP methyl ester carboxylesterase